MEGRRGGGQVRSVGGSSLRRGVRTITLSKPLVVRPSHWHRHWHHHRHHHRIYPRVTHTHPRPPSITIYLSLFLSPSPVSLAFHPCVYPNPVPSFTHLHVPPLVPSTPEAVRRPNNPIRLFPARMHAYTKACNFGVRNARTSASQTMFAVDGGPGALLWKMPSRNADAFGRP